MFVVDLLRVVVIVVCVASLYIMGMSYFRNSEEWNEKTRDYWYGRMMWTLFGVSGSLEGILRDTPFRYSLVLAIAASLVTLKGNLNRSSWGSGSDERKRD